MNSLPRLLNKLTLLTWWRTNTSKSVIGFFPRFLCVCDCATHLFLPVNQHRAVRNPNYGWRALRLLSRRSPHFFQPTNQKFKSLADYLDSMVSKLAKELPVRNCFLPLNVLTKTLCAGLKKKEMLILILIPSHRRTSLLKRSRRERRMTTIMATIFSKTMTVSLSGHFFNMTSPFFFSQSSVNTFIWILNSILKESSFHYLMH